MLTLRILNTNVKSTEMKRPDIAAEITGKRWKRNAFKVVAVLNVLSGLMVLHLIIVK